MMSEAGGVVRECLDREVPGGLRWVSEAGNEIPKAVKWPVLLKGLWL